MIPELDEARSHSRERKTCFVSRKAAVKSVSGDGCGGCEGTRWHGRGMTAEILWNLLEGKREIELPRDLQESACEDVGLD